MYKVLTIDRLEEGMELQEPVTNSYGQVLFSAGSSLSSKSISTLEHWNIHSVIIKIDDEGDIKELTEEEISSAKEYLMNRMDWQPRNTFEEEMISLSVNHHARLGFRTKGENISEDLKIHKKTNLVTPTKIDDINKIILKLNNFPTLPTIYTSIMNAISDPRSTIQDVANIVSKDQTSVAKLLKFVNSAVFGLMSEIDTVTQAIFMLGFNEVKNQILTLSVMKLFGGPKDSTGFNIVDYWKHSIAVAVITKLLGQNLGIKNIENYFIAGLMHDIGKLVFYRLFPDEFDLAVNFTYENRTRIRFGEQHVFGIDHTLAGDLLAEKWKLPANIRHCILAHHTAVVEEKIDKMVACVHLANIIAEMLELGKSGDYLIDEPNIKIWNELNFKENTIINLYDQIMIQYEQSNAIFKFD